MATLIGPDVSFYQDDPQTPQGINFPKMRQSAEYVIIRAGQNLWVDSDFKLNWREAKLAGFPRGSYWFYDSRADPKRQAELWVEQFVGDFGELPLFADFEEKYGGAYRGWKNWYNFLERLKQLIGTKEIAIYTAPYYWRDNAPNAATQTSALEYFHQYPLWIANYGVAKPSIPKPWGPDEWLFWQFTDKGDGKLYGVESNGIDLNHFNGDLTTFRARFKLSDVPPPPPPPPPPDEGMPTGLMYRVTAQPSLRVREGPGTSYPSIGLLYPNETVEEIGATADRAWLRIRRADNSLRGWSSATYLQPVITPPPPPPDETPITDPVPLDLDKKWYRVGIAPLSVRESPSANANILGTLILDDTIPALDESIPNWVQVRRVDGLTGWCEKKNLVFISNTRPISIRQNLFPGVTYLYKDLSSPRKNRMHVMAVDLQTIGLEFLVTPSTNTNGTLCTRVTSKFLKEFNLNFAVNADGFSYLDATTFPPATYCANGGTPVKANGFAASRGKIYSPKKTVQPIIYVNAKNQVAINGSPTTVFNAVSGDRVVVKDGIVVTNLAAATPSPRTAIGLNKTGRWLIFMVIDGRQPNFSEGVTFPELAAQLISYGVYSGVNMDGGGSSAMAIKGVNGKPRILNSPIDENIAGKERAVANHLGLFVKK